MSHFNNQGVCTDPKTARDIFIRDAKSNLILDAACKVFSEKGYHETRLDDIAAVAGFSKASLYNYYEDKESLFLNLVIRMHEKIIEALKTRIDTSKNITENLKVMFKTIFDFYTENNAFIMGMTDLKSMTPLNMEKFQQHHVELMSRFKDYQGKLNEFMLSIFTASRKRGEFESSIHDETLAKYISFLIRGILFDCKLSGNTTDTIKQTDDIIVFIAQGLNIKIA